MEELSTLLFCLPLGLQLNPVQPVKGEIWRQTRENWYMPKQVLEELNQAKCKEFLATETIKDSPNLAFRGC